MKHNIYLDHAATTYVEQEVLEQMLPWFTDRFGNPSSIYSIGRTARKAVENAREIIASLVHAREGEIFFTGSGTEADNWAIKGVAFSHRNKGNHIITSCIEHHAVLDTCRHLEKQGFAVTYVPVESNGIVNPDTIRKAIRDETILISVMHANNEIGTIQPVAEIGAIAKEREVFFHTDAVQSIGILPVSVKAMNVDLLSASAHKFYGPKGVGFLYVRKGTKLENLLHGGGQERTRRASTENVAGIVGLAAALQKAVEGMGEQAAHIKELRDETVRQILRRIPFTLYNGDPVQRLPGSAHFAFRFVEGESLLLLLDGLGIMASSGSACTSGSLDPSHVLLALGLGHETAHGSLRLSFGRCNTKDQLEHIVHSVATSVERLREISPLYASYLKETEG